MLRGFSVSSPDTTAGFISGKNQSNIGGGEEAQRRRASIASFLNPASVDAQAIFSVQCCLRLENNLRTT
jgi:hypothetical protein